MKRMISAVPCRIITALLCALCLLPGCQGKAEKAVAPNGEMAQMSLIRERIQGLDNEKGSFLEKLQEVKKEYVSFSVNGKYASFSFGGIGTGDVQLVGTAEPSNNDWNQEGAVRDGHLIVRNPRRYGVYPTRYIDRSVYYVGKASGSNSGSAGPVRIYTTEGPPPVEALKNKIAAISREISRLNDDYAQSKEALLRRIKDNPAELVKTGDAFMSREDIDGAFRAYRRALELTPGDADVRVSLAYIYLKQNKPRAAAEEYKTALLYNPKVAEARGSDALPRQGAGEKPEGVDQAYEERGAALKKEIEDLESEVRRAEESGIEEEVALYRGKLEEKKKEYESLVAEAAKGGLAPSVFMGILRDHIRKVKEEQEAREAASAETSKKGDLGDKGSYASPEQEAAQIRKDIESSKLQVAMLEKSIARAKKYGYWGASEKRAEEMIAEKRQHIASLEERLRKIEAELSRASR